MQLARHGGPGLSVVGVCQGGLLALAATALLAAADDPATTELLTLIAAPVDPLARPTRVVGLLRERPPAWFAGTANSLVSEGYPGAGRLVYPAQLQLTALLTYLRRHLEQTGELRQKVRHDDGADPRRFPFLDLYSSMMDLDAIEGREDDIAAPGQTSAAHALCTALPTDLHQKHVISRAGHFSLFHGAVFRREVLPILRDFCSGPRVARVALH